MSHIENYISNMVDQGKASHEDTDHNDDGTVTQHVNFPHPDKPENERWKAQHATRVEITSRPGKGVGSVVIRTPGEKSLSGKVYHPGDHHKAVKFLQDRHGDVEESNSIMMVAKLLFEGTVDVEEAIGKLSGEAFEGPKNRDRVEHPDYGMGKIKKIHPNGEITVNYPLSGGDKVMVHSPEEIFNSPYKFKNRGREITVWNYRNPKTRIERVVSGQKTDPLRNK
jgi:hypothetical protein